jgi:hypothetical protein
MVAGEHPKLLQNLRRTEVSGETELPAVIDFDV